MLQLATVGGNQVLGHGLAEKALTLGIGPTPAKKKGRGRQNPFAID